MKHQYYEGKQRFFDYLVVFFGSMCGIGSIIAVQRRIAQTPFTPDKNIIIRGKLKVSGIELVFYPYELLESISNRSWPKKLEWTGQPLKSDPASMGFTRIGVRDINTSLIQSCFVHYFESVRPLIENKYNADTQSWPIECNFGRVVRNAFAHGGKIHFTNISAQPVSWKTLTYSPADNGRDIVFQDLTPVELILLMEDIEASL